MGKCINVILGVVVTSHASITGAWAESLPMTIPAPLPKIETPLPVFPGLHPTRFLDHSVTFPAEATEDFAEAVDRQADINAFGFACRIAMQVEPVAGAMLNVSISAPCEPNHTVELAYEGLKLNVTLSLTGDARFQMPALARYSQISAVIGDADKLVGTATTPDLDGYFRVALGWSDPIAPVLGGKAPRHLPIDVMTIGDGAGRVVQVVSHHLDPEAETGVIRLGMHVPVTKQNCATMQSGQVVQHTPGFPQLRYGLTLAPAGCDRVGQNLELKNILQDLKLAAN